MAVEEDSADALDFGNTGHYILHDIFPLNLPAALYHLNKASLLGHTGARSLFAILSKIGSRSLLPSTPLPESTFDKPPSASSTLNTAPQLDQTHDKRETRETRETSKSSPSASESPSNAAAPSSENANTQVKTSRKLSMADWKVLEHIFQDLSSAGKSPSALMLEGYQHLFGIDTQTSQCHVSKRVLRDATAPLLELLKAQTPAPRLEFNQLASTPSKLPELYSGQSMGAHKISSPREQMAYIDYYTDLAREPDHHHSKNTIGSIYLYGTFGYERDYSMAHRYYKEADSAQNPSANLGYLFHQGLGVSRDINRAMSQYSRAAAQNSSFALTQLGLLFLRGDSEAHIEPNIQKAMNYLTKAADKENADANFHLGMIYRQGLHPLVPADMSKAHKYTIFAATRGHLGAQLELATLTARCEDSVHLYTRVLSTALLHPLAFRAYEFYERGMYDHAAVLYNIMGSLGHDTGQINAAWLHERGLVSTHLTPLDFANLLPLSVPSLAQAPHGAQTLATAHFKQSFDSLIARLSALGSASESSALADLLLSSSRTSREHDEDSGDENLQLSEMSDSEPIVKSIGEKEFASWEHQRHAFELYLLAAQQGNPEAQLKLGDFYYYGTGIAPDYNRSAQLYLSAANSKHAQAAFNLGYMHQLGVGVPTDFHLAKRYYDQAIASSPDAYFPASIALISLQAQNFVFGTFDPLDIAWDNSLFAILLISTIIALTLKYRIRNLA